MYNEVRYDAQRNYCTPMATQLFFKSAQSSRIKGHKLLLFVRCRAHAPRF